MEQSATASTRPIIYSSSIPDLEIPKISTFESLLPTNDPYEASRTALTDALTGESCSRGALRHKALTLAAALMDCFGLKKGQVVMILSPNSLEYPILVLAAIAAGLPVTFANPDYQPTELLHQLTDSDASLVFAHPDSLPNLRAALARSSGPSRHVVLTHHARETPSSVIKGVNLLLCLDELWNHTRQLDGPIKIDGEDAIHTTAFLFYSSGTTGQAKGVEITHHNMVAAFEQATSNWQGVHADRDTMLAAIPWYHIAGGCVTMLYPIHAGAPIVILPRFEPTSFLEAIERFSITVMVVAPPILMFFLNSPLIEKYNVTSLRTILCGSAPASSALITNTTRRLWSRGTKVTMGQAYGLTETCGGTFVTPPAWAEKTAGLVGCLLPNMKARLVDDQGLDVLKGEKGELWIKGPNVMKGYLNNPDATNDTFTVDGWLKTGDIATINTDGFALIVDRKKELIKYKGYQVPPAELEAILSRYHSILDSAVVGVFSDEQQTELPRAYVVPRDRKMLRASPTVHAEFALDVQNWVKTQVVHYKQLRGGVFVVQSIPRSQAGKILRKELRLLSLLPLTSKL